MVQTTLKVDGMMCGMCESHVNDCIRQNFTVKKVTSSHTKGETVILSEAPLNPMKLRSVIGATGYEVGDISTEDVEAKTGFFARLFRKK